MNKLDRIISALYLAKSDNREKMLADLVQNILYSAEAPIDIDTLIENIAVDFHLDPIKYEIQESLDSLVSEGDVCTREHKYCLADKARSKIHAIVLRGQSESDKRYATFKHGVEKIYDGSVTEEEIQVLWTVFNSYLLECFMVFGRRAIDIFLPFKHDELDSDDDIFKESYLKLESDKLIAIFKKVVVEYPEMLAEAELRYLTVLATRAERFYSLGVEKEEYQKIKDLEIKDLVVLVDTNILYSILDLRSHQENAAISELLRIAKEKQIELRLVYLPKTYSELQKAKSYLDRVISKVKFRIPQIRAMLYSDRLDSFARKYYESKLNDSDLPHPSERITYAKDILKSLGIDIYNSKFPKIEDDTEYINERIAEYYDFQQYYNRICDERGYDFHLSKDDKKIEHDVFLREGVKILKSKYLHENELRFICLTLDRSLIHFDHYSLHRDSEGTHEVVNPNFIQPSQFIKRIRPFIPISTNDYRKAFISSVTAPNFEKDDDTGTILIQKSMTYFNSLGIENEEVILHCIKRELFLEEFEKHERDNTTEVFIKTEVAREIDRMKVENEKLAKEMSVNEQLAATIIEKKEKEKEAIIEEKEKAVASLTKEKSQTEQSNSQLIERVDRLEKEMKMESRYHSDTERWQNDRELRILKNWDELPKRKWYLPLFVSGVTITVIIAAYLYYIFQIEAYVAILVSLSLFVMGTLLSFFNRDKIEVSFKIHFRPEKYRKEKMKEFEKQFMIESPQPRRSDYKEHE